MFHCLSGLICPPAEGHLDDFQVMVLIDKDVVQTYLGKY